MANIRVELNSAEVRGLLQSGAMASLCRSLATAIAGRAGTGYTVTTYTGATRVNASVMAETPEAMRDNLENNTLLKAMK